MAGVGVAGVLVLATAGPVQAHDTWLTWSADGPAAAAATSAATAAAAAGGPRAPFDLVLGTGERYPAVTSGMPVESLKAAACLDGQGGGLALRPLRNTAQGLWLRAAPAQAPAQAPALQPAPRPPRGRPAPAALPAPSAAWTCWAQTEVMAITLSPELVDVYLNEVRPPEAVRRRWAELSAQGRPWREHYAKHARIELPAAAGPSGAASAADAPAARPRSPLPWDLVIEDDRPAGAAGSRVPAPLTVRLWRDGVPAADQAVEWLADELPRGLWLRSGADGRVQLPALARDTGGGWLLRGIELLPPEVDDGPWRSRFFSLSRPAAGPVGRAALKAP